MNMRIVKSILFLGCLLAGTLPVAEALAEDEIPFNQRHQAGVRIGVWANQGDDPPAYYESTDRDASIRTDISSSNMFFEATGAYRLLPHTMLEVSFGFVNRGDVTIIDEGRTYIGSLLLYPMLVSLKYYLPVSLKENMYTYVQAGGGVYYGRHSVQFTNDYYFPSNAASGTDLSYMLGGGFDYVLIDNIGLEFNVRYMPNDYSNGLILVSDYSALTVTVGVKYLFKSKKK